MTTIDQMLIFDVDGVITNLENEIITEPFIPDYIIKILKKDKPVALNTGRGIDWTQVAVLNPLKNKIINQGILKNLFVVTESGGITGIYDQTGNLNIKIDESLKMPTDLDQKVRELVKTKYFQIMRYEDKLTMITTKIREGTPIGMFHRGQVEIVKDLQKLIDDFDANDRMRTDISSIGTNIMYKSTGKDKGIELTLDWLLKKNIKPQKFIAFGDSLPDIAMAEKLYEKGNNVEFVYVGENPPENKYPFPIIITKNKFEKGTIEYLKTI